MSDINERALEAHKKYRGKLEICSKVPLKTKDDLSLFYTPGVAEPCRVIAKNPETVYDYTSKGNMVAVISDGTAVLGLGDIGPAAAMPVMEGKAVLFKAFGGVDAIPICLDTTDPDEIVAICKALAPSFGGINLEDIKAPNCFEIEEQLIEALDIPVFHDDQHGTAIVVAAGLINALKIVGKKMEDITVVVSGAGAAGIATTKLLLKIGVGDVILQDSKGLIYEGRDGLNPYKERYSKLTNKRRLEGTLADGLKGADVVIGVSRPRLVDAEMVKTMAKDPIIFAMSNPDPEIMPDEAKRGGAAVVATGRSDYPNQINNVLAFPGIFRGVFDARARKITDEMKIAAAEALAAMVANPTPEKIIPGPFDEGVAEAVAAAVKKLAQ